MKSALLIIFACFSIICKANDSFFKLKTIEGKSASIKLSDNGDVLKVILANHDTITISDFISFESNPNVSNKSYLKLEIKIRGGSGIKIKRLLLISICGNKLIPSLDIFYSIVSEIDNLFTEDTLRSSYSYYSENKIILQSFLRTKKVTSLSVFEKSTIKENNVVSYKEVNWVLKYDNKRNIFYSSFENEFFYLNFLNSKYRWENDEWNLLE